MLTVILCLCLSPFPSVKMGFYLNSWSSTLPGPWGKRPGASPPLCIHRICPGVFLTSSPDPGLATEAVVSESSQNQSKAQGSCLPLPGGPGAGMRSRGGARGLLGGSRGNLATEFRVLERGHREGHFQLSGVSDHA